MPVVSEGWAVKVDQEEAESPESPGSRFLDTIALAGIFRPDARTPSRSSHSDCMGAVGEAFWRRGICVLMRFLAMTATPSSPRARLGELNTSLTVSSARDTVPEAWGAARFLDNPSSFDKVVT